MVANPAKHKVLQCWVWERDRTSWDIVQKSANKELCWFESLNQKTVLLPGGRKAILGADIGGGIRWYMSDAMLVFYGFLVFLKVLVVWRWSWLVTPNSEQSAVTWCAGGARNRSNRNLAYRLGGTLVWLDSHEPSKDVALRCLATGGQKADPLMPGSADCSPQDCAIYWRWSRETHLGSIRAGKNCNSRLQVMSTIQQHRGFISIHFLVMKVV